MSKTDRRSATIAMVTKAQKGVPGPYTLRWTPEVVGTDGTIVRCPHEAVAVQMDDESDAAQLMADLRDWLPVWWRQRTMERF